MDRYLSGKVNHRQPLQYQEEIKARKRISEKTFHSLCTSEGTTLL